ncbi:MAG: hypothetical protein JSU98_05060 [Gemmatimonadales bacterium]|jgi:hypothetical protein|nr:MAG: hypothetical protein JSU98_05060 [Gemmatimonadales bacterium]
MRTSSVAWSAVPVFAVGPGLPVPHAADESLRRMDGEWRFTELVSLR